MHHNPPIYGNGLGAPLARYCAKTGHCCFECPSVWDLVHHISSRTSFPFFKLCSSKVMLTNCYWSWSIPNADLNIDEASNLIAISRASLYKVTFCCTSGNWIRGNNATINHSECCCAGNTKLTYPSSVLNRWSKYHTNSCGIYLISFSSVMDCDYDFGFLNSFFNSSLISCMVFGSYVLVENFRNHVRALSPNVVANFAL